MALPWRPVHATRGDVAGLHLHAHIGATVPNLDWCATPPIKHAPRQSPSDCQIHEACAGWFQYLPALPSLLHRQVGLPGGASTLLVRTRSATRLGALREAHE